VRALITHCGYNSITEATYAGVPLVVLPLWGDQFMNAKQIEKRQLGVVLDKTNLTEHAISDALQAVLFDKK
jgi:UDP:flavonoid glycosyltransferase YjiC (YdhE family)